MGSVFRKKIRSVFFVCIICITLSSPLWAQTSRIISKIEFIDIPITEILIALANYKNASVISDQTVNGNASFSIVNKEVDEAMSLFLAKYDLYLKIEKGIYYVSKIKIEYDPVTKLLTLDANEVMLRQLIEAISKTIGTTIQYDTLPALAPSIHANKMPLDELLQMILVRANDYKIEKNANYYYIKHLQPSPAPGEKTLPDEPVLFEKKGGIYNVNQKRKTLQELVRSLFTLENVEYNFMIKRAVTIEEFKFRNKTFEELLGLLLEIGNADFTIRNNIYYIFEVDERDILKDYKKNIYLTLEYLSPTDIQRIMPNDLSSSKFYRIDQNTNTIILSGSDKEIEPLRRFIKEVDRPLGGNQYYRYDLNFVKAMNIRSMLPFKYRNMEIITIPETNSLLMLLTPQSKQYMDEFLMILDRNIASFPITLKYIKSEDFMKNVPPAVYKEDIVLTNDPSVIFFKGSNDKLMQLQRQLEIFDKPVPQIRYEVLVVSYSEDEGLNWRQGGKESNIDYVFPATDTAKNIPGLLSFIGSLSSVLALNFDFPSAAGLTASFNLNLALSSSKAKVMTDTTLYGISGQKLNFQDTETYRYQTAAESTSTTAAAVPGPIREIVTGFTLNIEGWVSGESMITMNINISIKKQGNAPDEKTGNLGSTFDKVVTTTARVSSGQPLKVGGLIKQDTEVQIEKIPLLGDIPYVGLLFQKKKETIRKSEIVVYILPHIEKLKEEIEDANRRIENLYTKYIKQ